MPKLISSLYPEILTKLKSSVFKNLDISDFSVLKESQEYSACRFNLNSKTVEFREAKTTPKKTGQFVTIWRRNNAGITQPFCKTDHFDYIIVACETDHRFGVFIFPKSVLIEKKIVTANGIEGKRGIRVYPLWDTPSNPQSQKTQTWQSPYFVEDAFTDYFL